MSEPAPRAERKTPPTPIPFTVLTGFLGAGKTTLLNRLLKDPALAETAVVINEFGEVGLDHLLVEYVSDNMVLLQSGCLCCTMRGDLVDALETLLRDLDNRRCTFKRLLLETTGLADPAPVLHTAMSHPYLVLRYRLDGVITVADAAAGEATLDAHLEAVKQAAVADRIVLTKTDIAGRAHSGNELLPGFARSILRRRSSTPPRARRSLKSCSEAGFMTLTGKSLTSRNGLPPKPMRTATAITTIITTLIGMTSTSALLFSQPTMRSRRELWRCFSSYCAPRTAKSFCASKAS